MTAYLIKGKDIDSMLITFADYVSLVGMSVNSGVASVNRVIGLEAFTGEAAISIKAYFSRVHLTLMYSFVDLFTQLEMLYSEYADSYFSGGDIGESETACLPKDEIIHARNRFRSFLETDIPTIERLLESSASLAAEAGCSVCKPGMSHLDTSLQHNIDEISKLDNGVVTAESKGAASFSGNQLFESLANAVSMAIAACAKPGYAENFNETLFLSGPIATQLHMSMQACEEYQKQNWDKMISAENAAMAREQKRIQIEYEKASLQKAYFSGVGVLASTVGILIGAAAVITASAPLGPFGLAMAAYSLYSGAKDLSERYKQYLEIFDGNAEYDRGKEYGFEKPLDKFIKIGGGYVEDYMEKGDPTNLGVDIGKEAVNKGTSMLTEEALSNMGLGDSEASSTGDAVGEAVSFFIKSGFEDPSDLDVVKFGTKIATIGADYKMEKADQQLDACNKKSDELDSKIGANEQRQQVRYSDNWAA